MAKKITITLSDEAEEYFNEVAYSLDDGNGKVATNSAVINHCLVELKLFEEMSGDQVTSHLKEYFPDAYQKWLNKKSWPKTT